MNFQGYMSGIRHAVTMVANIKQYDIFLWGYSSVYTE